MFDEVSGIVAGYAGRIFTDPTSLLCVTYLQDPDEDEDHDEERTKQLLDVTIKCLEYLDDAGDTLEGELVSEAPVSRRPVTTDYSSADHKAEKAKVTAKGKNKSLFAGAIDLLKLLRSQSKKRDTISYATYPRHPEVCNKLWCNFFLLLANGYFEYIPQYTIILPLLFSTQMLTYQGP